MNAIGGVNFKYFPSPKESAGSAVAGTSGAPGSPGSKAAPPSSAGAKGAGQKSSSTPGNLSAEEQAVVTEMKRTDTHVKNHEAAHMAAGAGVVTGGASYTYRRGPDGGMYAVAGEVPIAIPNSKDPAERLQKAEQVQRSALAPSDPSSQDISVAAAAAQVAAEARTELSQQRTRELGGDKAVTTPYAQQDEGPQRQSWQQPVNVYA